MRGQGPGPGLSAVVATAAIAPLLAEPAVRAEQVSQLVLGETATVLEASGPWRRLRVRTDGYEGWTHLGYLRELSDGEVERWAERAHGWSDGAELEVEGARVRLPLRARVALAGGSVALPDGRSGRVVAGSVRPLPDAIAEARRMPAVEWAARYFLGAPYLWGGVTPWGVDCSGLVQTTYAARGVALPRDSRQQILCGAEVPLDAARPGDLLFFLSESGSYVNHIAFAAEGDALLHATLACGGVVREPWRPGARAWALRERLAGVRRIAD